MKEPTIQKLLLAIRRLPATMPETDRLYKSGYPTHKDHWLSWAGDYNDAEGGYYGRSDTTITGARILFQRLNCGPMIIWLAEAAGESPSLIRRAIRDMERHGNGRAQTEAKIARQHFRGSVLFPSSSKNRISLRDVNDRTQHNFPPDAGSHGMTEANRKLL